MTQYEGEGYSKTVLGAILKDYQLGKIKLSKQSLRELEKALEKKGKRAERKLKPKSKKPGHRGHLRKIWRKGCAEWRKKNPDYEYTLNRRYTRLLKHCREAGIECTLTLAEYEILMEGVTPEDDVRIVRKDLSKGFTAENSVVISKDKYSKLLALRNRAKKQAETAN